VKPHPRVHILVVNFNRWRDTLECLESVFRLDYPNFRVVVCDNASADGSFERLKAWAEERFVPEPAESEHLRCLSWPPVCKPVAYVEYSRASAEQGGDMPSDDPPLVLVQTGGNLGFTGGSNVGLRYLMARGATGYIWLLNNDTVVAADALRRLVDVAERDERIGVVGTRLFHYARPDVVQAAGGGRITRWHGMVTPVTDDADGKLDFVTGASMLIPLPVLSRVGLLDERYFAYSEEVDWCFRMRARGFRLAYCPAAKVWHKEGQTLGRRTPFQDYLIVRNTLLLVQKFFTPFLPVAILYSLYRSFLPKLVRGEWKRLGAVVRAYRDFVREVARGEPEGTAAAGRVLVSGWAQRKAS
jgi:GT2 family glycosyltransferase